MEDRLCKISAYLDREEMRQFMVWVKARGVGQSGFIREQLSFDVRPRGAPKGPRRKKAQKAKPAKTKEAGKKKGGPSSSAERRESQLSLLE